MTVQINKSVVSEAIAVGMICQTVIRQMHERIERARKLLNEEIQFGVDGSTEEGKLLIAFFGRMGEVGEHLDNMPALEHTPLLEALYNAGQLDTKKVEFTPGKAKVTLAGVLS